MAKQIAIQDVQPGMVIIGVIEQNGPVKIRKSGLVTSSEMVQGLAEMGVISVAIDPEQTVEIEPETAVHVSQTQFVMQANAEQPGQDTDSHLAEQFNRSLFLPSLQKVPSAWQYYGIKSLVAVGIVVTGFTVGWFASQFPMIGSKSIPVNEVAENTQERQQNVPANSDKGTIENTATKQDVIEVATQVTETSEQINPVEETQEIIAQSSNLSQPEADIEEGRVITNASEFNQTESNISPDVMKRFEAAMADLERESSPDRQIADDGSLEYGDATNDYNTTDVQRVDQLPARIMTRLPNMSFSAHMYASNPRDRWVKLNGIEMGEGEWFEDKIFLDKIEPQHVILIFEGHEFSMRALSEW